MKFVEKQKEKKTDSNVQKLHSKRCVEFKIIYDRSYKNFNNNK